MLLRVWYFHLSLWVAQVNRACLRLGIKASAWGCWPPKQTNPPKKGG